MFHFLKKAPISRGEIFSLNSPNTLWQPIELPQTHGGAKSPRPHSRSKGATSKRRRGKKMGGKGRRRERD